MHGHVSYRGPRPSLVTGVLLWLVRGSATVYIPAPLRDMNSIYSFRKQLKTHLFSGGIVTMFLRVTNTLTYLLT